MIKHNDDDYVIQHLMQYDPVVYLHNTLKSLFERGVIFLSFLFIFENFVYLLFKKKKNFLKITISDKS